MSKFKLTQTAAEVQGILNNSLQKPTGLTKTKLVGVGVNGQENIEIGDNLTLANGKLSAAAGGGGGGTAIHVYMVIVDNMFNYPVYTSKDFGLKNLGTIENFWTDENYKELRPTGRQPASGHLYKDTDGTDRIMCSFIIGSTPSGCYAYGYDLKKKRNDSVNYIPGLHAQVRQLY